MRFEDLSAGAAAALLSLLLLPLAPPVAAEWRVEPLYGGEVRSLAFAPEDPDLVLAGTSAGQVYRSRDGGRTWGPPGRSFPLPGWTVASLHFDENDPGRLWAGLRGVWGGGAVVRSDDFGTTWETVTRRRDGVFVLRTVRGRPGTLVLGTDSGVWIRRNVGGEWEHSSRGVPGLVEVSSLLVDSEDPLRILAGTFRRAFRSDDGGRTWRGVFDGMRLDTQLFSLQEVPGKRDTYWASTCGWVYRSEDGGLTWKRFRDGLAQRRTPGFQALSGGRLLAGTVAGIYLSDDDGQTWSLTTRNDLSIHALAHHPRRPEIVLAGTEGSGVWRSEDGGTTFRPASRGLTAPRVGALAAGPGTLRAAVVH
ncbi:MAG: sialidase family protein, partial [Thermoanaerobaculia bacterium]|nr:sialidase family protein [Thermoanaerobaculia bacterium]